MKRLWLTKVGRLAALVAFASTALLVTGGGSTVPAGADPGFTSSYAAVGSDTIQDVMDALAGAEPYPGCDLTGGSDYYVPLHSSVATGSKTISSFDAIPCGGSSAAPGCISTKLGGPSFDRPNGSGNGIAALSHAVDPTPANNTWQAPVNSCTGAPVNVAGQIDFARASRGPNNTTTNALTYIPFSRDGLSYAYIQHGTQDITHLTTAQLTSLYSSVSGTINVGGDTVRACLANTGSGTTGFWLGAIGVTQAQAVAAATAACGFVSPGVEENGGDAFLAAANAINNTDDFVIDFSAGSWIAQANLVAIDRTSAARAAGVDLGNPDQIGGVGAKPYTGVPGSETPNATYYNFSSGSTLGTYGRNLYVVVPTAKIGLTGDAALKSLFVGGGAAICQTGVGSIQARINTFGFLTLNGIVGTCGATTLTGSLYS
jgi:hypothetical protein